MIERRNKREIYFQEQDYTTEKYVVPYIQKHFAVDSNTRVLEIGCGEGGNLKYFIDKGCEVLGLDLNKRQLENAKEFTQKFCKDTSKTSFLNLNVYNAKPEELGKFDLVMMRDVIEHIPDQEKFISFLLNFVKEDGVVFFGFPPWYMPFGGHQQGCNSFLRAVPYFHILPSFLYKFLLKLFGESENKIAGLLQTKVTGISIDGFKRIVRKSQWNVLNETLYLINPNYDIKFKLKPRKQLPIIRSIPFFRNFVTTCAYYIITPKK
ncbi:MAG: class I SAM-dependent methyltransferase [Chitinophagales bacterium]|nr:class I SAM-dependent methyltransferase [Chitinophagales bacterium]